MVTAKLIPKPVIITEDDVQITLSMDEARSLKELTGLVAGNPSGYRQDTEAIYHELEAIGIKTKAPIEKRFEFRFGSLYGLDR